MWEGARGAGPPDPDDIMFARSTRSVAAALAAAALLIAAATATATQLEFSRSFLRVNFNSISQLRFQSAFISATCTVVLEPVFEIPEVVKTTGWNMGYLDSMTATTCSSGRATVRLSLVTGGLYAGAPVGTYLLPVPNPVVMEEPRPNERTVVLSNGAVEGSADRNQRNEPDRARQRPLHRARGNEHVHRCESSAGQL
jgi:hypothetical protein